MNRHPPRSTLSSSSAASDVYKRQELLKQPLYHPLSLHEKVITLCAATHKVLLGVEKTKIKQFQYDMLQMFEIEHPEIGQEIEEKKALTEELIDKIVETAKEFKKSRC